MKEFNKKSSDDSATNSNDLDLNAVYDVPLKVSVVLGKTEMKLNQILKLTKGSVIELDKKVGEPVEFYVSDRLIAKGEVVLVDDKIGITLTELIRSEKII